MKPFATTFLLLTLVACSGTGDRYDATGTFETTEVVVSAEASGRLLCMDVEEGMKLEAGQAVGQVDTVQLYLKKLQLEASARSVSDQRPDIRKQIAATQEQIRQAERERDRVKRLLEADAANRKQLDDAESLLQVLRKQLAAQNSSLQNSDRSLSWQSSSVDIQVAQVDDQLAKCRVCAPVAGTVLAQYAEAPVAGTVLAQYAEAGEFVAPGTPLFRLGDMERMYLRAYVTGEQLAEVRLGQTVTVVADYGGGQQREYEGQVTWISDTSEFTPKNILTRDERANLVYAVKVAVRNDGGLKIGMYGGLRFSSVGK